MKMKLFISMFVFLTVANGSAWAEDNWIKDFQDVPPGNWVYPALAQLVEAGQIDGQKSPFVYRPMTRYEFAVVVDRYLDRRSTTDNPAQDLKTKDIVEALRRELAPELQMLSSRGQLTKRTSSEKRIAASPPISSPIFLRREVNPK